MGNTGYQQCVRCVMDTSDPEIVFDDAGRCNHCVEYIQRAELVAHAQHDAELQLDMLMGRIKAAGRSSRYDCVIGLSGGADSCYVTYVAARKLGLRVLAVHMDNGWNTAIALRNVRRTVQTLGTDYTSVVLDWEEFKDLQLAFLKASVPEIETPTDIAIPAALHQVAAAHGVKYIVTGGNIWTEGILPKAWHYDAKDMKYLSAIHQRFGSRKLRTFPTFGYPQETYYKVVKGLQFVYLLEHVKYTTEDATRLLRDELGWEPPSGKHHESTITRFVQSYILPVKFDIDYRRATYSTQICAGELTKERALADLEKPPFDETQIEADKRYVAKKFGITPEQLNAIIASPPKCHRDYPNDERFLQGIYNVYRRFFSPRRHEQSRSSVP